MVAMLVLGGLFLLGVLGAWLWAKRRFVSTAEGLVQIEHRLKLNNALTTAALGAGPWPTVPVQERIDDGISWKWASVVAPMVILISCLALAFFLPIQVSQEAATPAVPLPSSAQAAENMIKELEKAEVAREEDLEKFKQALESLKQQGPEEWYNHSTLEAADHLKESLGRSANELGNNYEKAGNSLDKLSDPQNTPAAKQQAASELANALEGLQNGDLQPNAELMEKLKSLDPKQLEKQLSKEEMKQLQEQLKKNAEGAKCNNPGQSQGQGEREQSSEEQAMRDAISKGEGEGEGGGEGEGEGRGKDGEGENAKEGAGGPSRGPGAADLTPKKKESDLGTNNPEKEQTRDLSRLSPGDLLGTSDGEHEVDKTATGTQNSKGTQNQGVGGDAVYRESLLPEEKRVLRKFFK